MTGPAQNATFKAKIHSKKLIAIKMLRYFIVPLKKFYNIDHYWLQLMHYSIRIWCQNSLNQCRSKIVESYFFGTKFVQSCPLIIKNFKGSNFY